MTEISLIVSAIFAAGGIVSIALSLRDVVQILQVGVIQTRDVDRAKVYKTHLGEKLR